MLLGLNEFELFNRLDHHTDLLLGGLVTNESLYLRLAESSGRANSASTQPVARTCVSRRPEYFMARGPRQTRAGGAFIGRRRQCDLRAEHEGAGVQHIIPVSRLPLK